MKIYIVIGLKKDNPPVVLGTYKNKRDAEKYTNSEYWINIIKNFNLWWAN